MANITYYYLREKDSKIQEKAIELSKKYQKNFDSALHIGDNGVWQYNNLLSGNVREVNVVNHSLRKNGVYENPFRGKSILEDRVIEAIAGSSLILFDDNSTIEEVISIFGPVKREYIFEKLE